MDDLDAYLASFDAEAGYLNWASFGPLSSAVREEARADGELLATGRTGGLDLVDAHVSSARDAVAELLGADAAEIVLQPSTGQGLLHTFFAMSGTVLLSPQEYPSLTVSARRAADALGRLAIRELDPVLPAVTAEAVREALDDEVNAVAVSLVDYRTGYVADLEAIRGVIGDRLLIVDGIQGIGVVDAAWDAADVVVGNGYKWLRAGRGTGFARFSARALDRLEPVLSGVEGSEGELGDIVVSGPRSGAEAFSVSRPDALAAGRLAVAVREVTDAGVATVAAAVAANAARVMEIADAHGIPVLTDRERHAGIVTLAPDPQLATAIGVALANAGVTVTVRSGLVRVAPHAGTREDTLGLLGDALAEAVARMPVHPGTATGPLGLAD